VNEETNANIDPARLRLVDAYVQPWAWHYEHLFEISLTFEQALTAGGPEIRDAGWFDLALTPSATLTVATRYAQQRLALAEPDR
jgi:hypothetical protein